jgi:hypothetical protein
VLMQVIHKDIFNIQGFQPTNKKDLMISFFWKIISPRKVNNIG